MASGLRFKATKPKVSWSTYFQNLFRPKFGGGFENYSDGPSVVAENARGETRVIATFKNFQEAKAGALALESDFKTLGVSAWCERNGVPPEFVC